MAANDDPVVVVRGETNYNYPHVYSCLFPAMIHDWRAKFQNPDMLFLFVQLAPSTQLGNFVGLRAAQMTALQLPQVGYSVAVDIGDISSPMGSIHPRRKQEVGRRLSLEARRLAYGASHPMNGGEQWCRLQNLLRVLTLLFWHKHDLKMWACATGESTLVSTGPVFASVAAGSKPDTLVVSYTPGSALGLHTAPTADCDKIGSKLCCGESPFQVRAAAAATTHPHLPRSLRGQLRPNACPIDASQILLR